MPFFFQAEDGIRDTSVTGVQTCALPISGHLIYDHDFWSPDSGGRAGERETIAGDVIKVAIEIAPEHVRSEERRVGKECRTRMAPKHKKKKKKVNAYQMKCDRNEVSTAKQ